MLSKPKVFQPSMSPKFPALNEHSAPFLTSSFAVFESGRSSRTLETSFEAKAVLQGKAPGQPPNRASVHSCDNAFNNLQGHSLAHLPV